jgi:hypothetical protein
VEERTKGMLLGDDSSAKNGFNKKTEWIWKNQYFNFWKARLCVKRKTNDNMWRDFIQKNKRKEKTKSMSSDRFW